MSEPAGERHDSGSNATKEKEEKYLVLKLDDIEKYLSPLAKEQLNHICSRIGLGRTNDGKKDNHYVVVNESEPYAEKVWDMILGREPKAKVPTWLDEALNSGDGVYRP
jgi:hypothetical protein